MNILTKISNLITHNFKPIWEDADREAAFELCNRIRQRIDVPEYSRQKFDEGYQYRNIFDIDYKAAKEEMLNLAFGWW